MRQLTASARAAVAQHLHALTHWLVFGVVVTWLWLAIPVQARVAAQLQTTPTQSVPTSACHAFSATQQKTNDANTTRHEGVSRSPPDSR
jgi:hypothetical protein